MTTRGEHSFPVRRVSSGRKRSADRSRKTPSKNRRIDQSESRNLTSDESHLRGTTSAIIGKEDDGKKPWIDNSFFSGGVQKSNQIAPAKVTSDCTGSATTLASVSQRPSSYSSTVAQKHTATVSRSACSGNIPDELNDSDDGLFADLEVPDVEHLAASGVLRNDGIFSSLAVSTQLRPVDDSQICLSLVPDTCSRGAYHTQHVSFNETDPLLGEMDYTVFTQVGQPQTQPHTQHSQTQVLNSTSCEVASSPHVAKTLYPRDMLNVSSGFDSDDSLLGEVVIPDSSHEPKVSVSVGSIQLNSCERNTKFTSKSSTSSNIPSNENITPQAEVGTPKAVNTPGGKSFRERLKNKLLQNTKVATPQAARTMESRRRDMMDRAILEAEQLRRRIHSQPDRAETGDFYGLSDKVREMFSKHRGISKLYDWQNECLGLPALQRHSNLIYSLPTSGGKTLVAEILMLQELLLRQKDAIFILPFVSIVQEKVRGLSPFAVDLNFLVEEYAASKGSFPPRQRQKKRSVYICTIEKANSLINSLIEHKRINDIGLVIVDELHMLGEGGSRGATLEMSLSKVMHSSAATQIVGMSATLNNIKDLQTFLNAEVYSNDFRPVELREYVKLEDTLYEVDHDALCPDDRLRHHSILSFQYTAKQQQLDPDRIGALVMEVIPKHSCLVFCHTKKNCENVAELVCRIMPRENLDEKRGERRAMIQALLFDGNGEICPVLRRTIPYGVAYHHSGLTMDERKLIEEAYSEGTLCMLACTSTLAAGVNLPAKRVILRSAYIGADFLSRSKYKQMIGRAGRAGIDTSGESIIILQKRDKSKLLDLVGGPCDYCRSSLLYENKKGIRSLLLTTVGLQITPTTKSVCDFLRKTLCHVQRSFFDLDLLSVAREGLQSLVDIELIVQKRSSSQDLDTQGQRSPNDKSHTLEVTKLGKAVVKGSVDLDNGPRLYQDLCLSRDSLELLLKSPALDNTAQDMLPIDSQANGSIDLDRGQTLYTDLKDAQKSLVVANYLHLIYLVTPYDMADNIKPNWMTFLDEIGCLDAGEVRVCELIGVTESFIARRVANQRIRKPVDERVVKRFYLSLMLYHLWRQKSIWQVASRFNQPRGFIQQLLNSAASFAACITHFCQELEEFWAYRDLLSNFVKRLSFCVSMELIPLLEIPGVKIGRARQLLTAGYKTLQLVAYGKPEELVEKIQHLPVRTARQIVSSAQMLLQDRAEALLEEADSLVTMPTNVLTESSTNQTL